MKEIIQLSRDEYEHLAECERQCKEPEEPYQFPEIEWKLDGPIVNNRLQILNCGHTKMPSKDDCLLAIVKYYEEHPDEPAYFGKSNLCQYMIDPTNPKERRTIHKYEYYVQWEMGWLESKEKTVPWDMQEKHRKETQI